MTKMLKAIGQLLYNFVFMIGVMSICMYTADRWPTSYFIVLGCVFSVGAAWYVWKYFIIPFRQGLHDSDPRKD